MKEPLRDASILTGLNPSPSEIGYLFTISVKDIRMEATSEAWFLPVPGGLPDHPNTVPPASQFDMRIPLKYNRIIMT